MQKHERRQRENGAGGDRGAGGGARGHDVVFEDIGRPNSGSTAMEITAAGNGGGDRDSGEQAHIGIRGGENDGQDDRKQDGLERELRCRTCASGHCTFPMSFFTGRLRSSRIAPSPTEKYTMCMYCPGMAATLLASNSPAIKPGHEIAEGQGQEPHAHHLSDEALGRQFRVVAQAHGAQAQFAEGVQQVGQYQPVRQHLRSGSDDGGRRGHDQEPGAHQHHADARIWRAPRG